MNDKVIYNQNKDKNDGYKSAPCRQCILFYDIPNTSNLIFSTIQSNLIN